MNWSFDIVDSPGHIRIVTGGIFRADGYLSLLNELFDLPDWKLGMPLLFDNRKLYITKASPGELIRSADDIVSFNGELAFTRISVLYDTAESMAAASRFGMIVDSRSSARIKRFLNEVHALDWITRNGD